MKQQIEIEVPEHYDLTGEFRRVHTKDTYLAKGRAYVWTSDVLSDHEYPILRRREPVRESRWRRCPEKGSSEGCCLWSKREDAIQVYSHHRLERLDYEDGKLVRVTLEEVSDG